MKRLVLLGATGSIGRRTLELVERFPDEFRVEGLAARGSDPALLAELCRRHRPRALALIDAGAIDAVMRALPRPLPEILRGPAGLVTLAGEVDADVVLSAIVGGAGLLPTMAAIRSGKAVALANKETLVMAGRLMTAAARDRGVPLLPVDSEHNAIFQCLQGHNRDEVERILLTCSGGPFRTTPKRAIADATIAQALRHPTWTMGAKITVDSATLMNKGLEVIEARWLFDLRPEQVQVVVHPQSVIHSMVEYVDGSVIAQLGVPDMGIPILYALTYPKRLPAPAERLDLTRVGALTFEAPDEDRFPCLPLARQALLAEGVAPVILNAANEVAVAAFLDGRARFMDIPAMIARALDTVPTRPLDGIETCVAVDEETRRAVRGWLPEGAPPKVAAWSTSAPLLGSVAALVDGDRLYTILRMGATFFVVIGILIVIHEFGHFAVARLSGVGVERFSIGFGPVLWSYRGPQTEYCISAIPLGGYVEMVGDDENPLEGGGEPVDPAKAFHLKPLPIRFLIVFAGPGMNFVLAAVIVALVLMMSGRPMSPPVIGRVTDESPAAKAGLQPGDRIVAVDGKPTAYWEDVAQLIQAGQGQPLRLTVRGARGEAQVEVTPVPAVGRDPLGDEHRYWHIGAFSSESPPAVIGQVVPDDPAARGGVKSGDTVLTVEGKPVKSWDQMADAIRKRPGQATALTVKRGAETLTLSVTPKADKDAGPDGKPIEIGRIGITQAPVPPRDAIFVRLGPLEAAYEGALKTVEWTVVTVRGLYKIVVGQLSRSNIGGPIQIAQAAGEQARQGIAPLALFTAVVSVNLAVLNLLPVPMLDGGHLLFFLIEGVLGRPLSERKRELAQQVGGALLLLLIGFALYNDLARLDVFGFFPVMRPFTL